MTSSFVRLLSFRQSCCPLSVSASTSAANAQRLDELRPFLLQLTFSNRYVGAAVVSAATPRSKPRTLVSASSREEVEELKGTPREEGEWRSTSDKAAAERVGAKLAERLRETGRDEVTFARPKGKRFHGKLRSLIEALVRVDEGCRGE